MDEPSQAARVDEMETPVPTKAKEDLPNSRLLRKGSYRGDKDGFRTPVMGLCCPHYQWAFPPQLT